MGVLMLRIVILPKPTWQAQKGDKKWGEDPSHQPRPQGFSLKKWEKPSGQGCLSTPTYDAG